MAPWAKLRANFDGLAVFELDQAPNFFLHGRGRLRADYDRIELSDLEPEEGKVVIKYHYLEGFRAEPPARLVAVPVPDDPIGFLGIENPPRNLVLRFAP
jgi:hypothetical protein